MKLSYITLTVEDVDKVREWYVTYFDMQVVLSDRDAVVLAAPEGPALELRKGRPLDHPERITLGFEVEDVDVTFKRLSDGKLPFLNGPRNTRWGRRVASLKDPAGHTVEVFTLVAEDSRKMLTVPAGQ